MNYFWVRIFDYRKECENADNWEERKGTLLDEYYLCGEGMTREQAKTEVKNRSCIDKFAKPRKNEGVYALVMDSTKFFYDRFNVEIDTICFNCHKPIKGKMKDFPNISGGENEEKYYFCCWDCKRETQNKINPYYEGEFQERTQLKGIYGYIYHIYNRKLNMHYIGQTIYMPFFRWQEHAKQHIKGDITDLIFETITEVNEIEGDSQEYLNNIEAWWIRKFIEQYGKENVMNVSVPKITMSDLVSEYSKIVGGQMELKNYESEVM